MTDMDNRHPKQTNFGETEGMRAIIDKENEARRKKARANLEMAGHKVYDSLEEAHKELPKDPLDTIKNDKSRRHYRDPHPDNVYKKITDAYPDWSIRKYIRTRKEMRGGDK